MEAWVETLCVANTELYVFCDHVLLPVLMHLMISLLAAVMPVLVWIQVCNGGRVLNYFRCGAWN